MRPCAAAHATSLARTMLALVALGGVAVVSPPARAAGDEPPVIIRRAVDQALDVLREPSLQSAPNRQRRRAQLRAIVDPVFDWHEMGRRSLGPSWQTLEAAKRRRFVALFTERIAERYMDDLDSARGDEKVLVEGSAPVGDGGDDEQRVDTVVITHSRERVPIAYFMYRAPAGWRVFDFSIEGVSLVSHYRGRFARFLVNHSVDQLLERMAHGAGMSEPETGPQPAPSKR